MAPNGLLLLAGSVRAHSLNRKLIDCAARRAESLHIPFTKLSLADYPLPIVDLEMDTGNRPAEADALQQAFAAHSAVIIASPEHNGSTTAILKNAIDWISRPGAGQNPQTLIAFRDKAFGLMSASPSPFGGLRGLSHLRDILSLLQGVVIPEQLSVPGGAKGFAEEAMADPVTDRLLTMIIQSAVRLGRKLSSA